MWLEISKRREPQLEDPKLIFQQMSQFIRNRLRPVTNHVVPFPSPTFPWQYFNVLRLTGT